MRWLDYFHSSRKNTARIAKERLQVIIAHERAYRDGPEYLPKLRNEIMEVIRKYIPIVDEQVKLQLEKEDDYEVLEINITIPDELVQRAS